jgi:DNA processing protein
VDETLFAVASAAAPRVRFDIGDPHLAAAAWSRLAEPGDEVAGALVGNLGAVGALAWLVGSASDPARGLNGAALAELVAGQGAGRGTGQEGDGESGLDETSRRDAVERLATSAARWATRLDSLDPRRELRVLDRYVGALLIPDDRRWPLGLNDLGPAAPFALWVRGDAELAARMRRSVAVVGARASTAYGDRVAMDLAAGVADRGFTVVSGGAYGIDAAAHRGALAPGGSTCAVMAGGVGRFYPQGNDELLRRVVSSGAVLSEVPPGSAPYKQRFLARNRLIAALTRATVVVEAAFRSGALSTARRAADLHRPVGVVPGPVTSMASSGCHALLRDGGAVCVTGAADAAELAGDLGADAVEPRDGRADGRAADALDPEERLLWDALPVRSGAMVDSIVGAAGLPPRRVLSLLGSFERRGLARRDGARWVRRT